MEDNRAMETGLFMGVSANVNSEFCWQTNFAIAIEFAKIFQDILCQPVFFCLFCFSIVFGGRGGGFNLT